MADLTVLYFASARAHRRGNHQRDHSCRGADQHPRSASPAASANIPPFVRSTSPNSPCRSAAIHRRDSTRTNRPVNAANPADQPAAISNTQHQLHLALAAASARRR